MPDFLVQHSIRNISTISLNIQFSIDFIESISLQQFVMLWYLFILWNKGSFYIVLVSNGFQSEQTKIAESDKIANI